MTKRGVWLLFLVITALLRGGPIHASDLSAPVSPPPEITGASAVIIDRLTGDVLYAKDAETRRPMASTTKIMTALLALERGDLSDVVRVSPYASRTGGSRIYLDAGEMQTLEDLLYALMLQSANDAAVAIAEHIGGSEEGFVRLMNERARQLGLEDTHFANPHGLTEDGHYTTALDLARLGRYAMLHETFRQIVVTKERSIPWPAKDSIRDLNNINDLLYTYEGATGIKTGYTSAAGQCLVASAKRGEDEVIAVILNAQFGHLYEDAAKLLDYGLSLYGDRVLLSGQSVVGVRPVQYGGEVDVVAAGRVTARLPLTVTDEEIERVVYWKSPPEAPLHRGYRMGTLQFRVHGSTIGEVPLVTSRPVDRQQSSYQAWWLLSVLLLYVPWRMHAVARRRQRRRLLLERREARARLTPTGRSDRPRA